MRRALQPLTILFLGAVLIGCGGTPTTTAPPPPDDPGPLHKDVDKKPKSAKAL